MLNSKTEALQTTTHVLTAHSKTIQELTTLKDKLELQLGESKALLTNYEANKEQFPDFLKELLLYITGKKSNIKQSFQMIGDELGNKLKNVCKDVLKGVGFEFKF